MGTNFYARVIPSQKRKEELKRLIDTNDFNSIKNKIEETFGRFQVDSMHPEITGVIHLGKRSAGWKFLWNPNIYIVRHGHLQKQQVEDGHFIYNYIRDPDTAFYLYPLTKQGIKEFIDRDDIEIYDEQGEKSDKNEFYQEAINWVTWKNFDTNEIKEAWDSKTYHDNQNNYYHVCDNELINYLAENGTEFISDSRSDFYSDGLRFATTTEFS